MPMIAFNKELPDETTTSPAKMSNIVQEKVSKMNPYQLWEGYFFFLILCIHCSRNLNV